MTGYLALAALLVLLALLTLALQSGHHRAAWPTATDDPDVERFEHELAAISSRTDDRDSSHVTELLAAANQATPWHRHPHLGRVGRVHTAR